MSFKKFLAWFWLLYVVGSSQIWFWTFVSCACSLPLLLRSLSNKILKIQTARKGASYPFLSKGSSKSLHRVTGSRIKLDKVRQKSERKHVEEVLILLILLIFLTLLTLITLLTLMALMTNDSNDSFDSCWSYWLLISMALILFTLLTLMSLMALMTLMTLMTLKYSWLYDFNDSFDSINSKTLRPFSSFWSILTKCLSHQSNS